MYSERDFPETPRFSKTKNELIAAVAEATGKTKADVGAVLGALTEIAAKTLKEGGDLTLDSVQLLRLTRRD